MNLAGCLSAEDQLGLFYSIRSVPTKSSRRELRMNKSKLTPMLFTAMKDYSKEQFAKDVVAIKKMLGMDIGPIPE